MLLCPLARVPGGSLDAPHCIHCIVSCCVPLRAQAQLPCPGEPPLTPTEFEQEVARILASDGFQSLPTSAAKFLQDVREFTDSVVAELRARFVSVGLSDGECDSVCVCVGLCAVVCDLAHGRTRNTCQPNRWTCQRSAVRPVAMRGASKRWSTAPRPGSRLLLSSCETPLACLARSFGRSCAALWRSTSTLASPLPSQSPRILAVTPVCVCVLVAGERVFSRAKQWELWAHTRLVSPPHR